MLTIFGRAQHERFCDGISRRGFLQIGSLALFGGSGTLTLADIIRAEARTGRASKHKAVIHIFLGGGPPHQDMWEIKTDAPAEIRGEFKPIATKLPGLDICEVFTGLAQVMDKTAVIRSVVGCLGRHDPFQCHTGWRAEDLRPVGGRPSLGSVVSKLQGPVDRSVPPFVGLANVGVWKDPGPPGFLGPTYAPFLPDGPALANMKLRGITTEQLSDRRRLLASFDHLRRDVDASGRIVGADSAAEQAFDVLTSNKLVNALDLSKEDPRIRARYGTGKPFHYQYDGSPTDNEQLLVARRLVEAGVRCVTLTYGRWDSHGQNFKLVRDHGAKLDQGLSALIEDLDARGMLDDVTVIAWGEFGRTPRVNKGAGRDHWPPVSCALLAGGGMRVGQVIGSTDRLGEHAKDRPVHMQEVIATLYHNLGIDTATAQLRDPAGRPQYLLEHPPIRELI